MNRYQVFKENNQIWTREKIASMNDQQKACLINLVKHMNPEIFDMKENVRKSWIRIMAGVYLRMLYNFGPEDYQSEGWKKKRERMQGFDITPLLYDNNKTQTPFNERGVVREEILDT